MVVLARGHGVQVCRQAGGKGRQRIGNRPHTGMTEPVARVSATVLVRLVSYYVLYMVK